jgi:hypothetical protein
VLKKVLLGVALGVVVLSSLALGACQPTVVNVQPAQPAPAAAPAPAIDNTMSQMMMWQQLQQLFNGGNNGGFGHHHHGGG